MRRLLELTLGIVTSIGGFLEAGSIITAVQAGATFGYQLLWAIALGTLGLMLLVEQSGRLAAVSGRTVSDALRERFGINFFIIPLAVGLLVSFLVLASEIGGVSLALQMATGTFVVPISERIMLVVKDTPQKRADVETHMAVAAEVCPLMKP